MLANASLGTTHSLTTHLPALCTTLRGLMMGSHAELVQVNKQPGFSPLQVDSVVLHNLEAADFLSHQHSFKRQDSGLKRQDSLGLKRQSSKNYEVDNVFLSSTNVPPLLRFRSEFSTAVWDSISALFRHQAFPEAVDVDCTYGRAAVQLARRGFRVTGIEPDVQLLAKARLSASVEGVELQLLGADQEKQRLATGSAQLVSVMHGFHLMHAPSALPEMHRLLQPGGYLVVAWNDRDTSDVLVQELEELMEALSPNYDRSHRLHDPPTWLPILTQGDLFELHSYEQHPNFMRLNQVSELVELLSSMRFMRPALEGMPQKRKFTQDVRAVATRHFPSFQHLSLPLVSKLYILRRV